MGPKLIWKQLQSSLVFACRASLCLVLQVEVRQGSLIRIDPPHVPFQGVPEKTKCWTHANRFTAMMKLKKCEQFDSCATSQQHMRQFNSRRRSFIQTLRHYEYESITRSLEQFSCKICSLSVFVLPFEISGSFWRCLAKRNAQQSLDEMQTWSHWKTLLWTCQLLSSMHEICSFFHSPVQVLGYWMHVFEYFRAQKND